jgi:branched-subunit amino acid ABC-type transport system permease component
MKNKLIFKVLIPLAVPLAFFMVAATPVELLGCRTRGLIAVGIALAGALTGLACAVKGLIDRVKGKPASGWWIISTLILALPAFYIVLFET